MKLSSKNKITDFGYQSIPAEEKSIKVAEIFNRVANQYDLMNDLMSLGIHRIWKRTAIAMSDIRPGNTVLDLAGGSGDMTKLIAKAVAHKGNVVLADINATMMQVGRDRMTDDGIVNNVHFAQVNAEAIPFADNSFDCVVIAFGLRNVTDKQAALASMCRVLKPGGRLIILEFSQPTSAWLKPFYDVYSFTILPALGQIVSGDAASYRYLAESIRVFPDQETITKMVLSAGFDECKYHNLSGGIVAIHKAYKY